MAMLRAGLAIGSIIIGAIAAFLGVVLMVSALKSGSIQFSYSTGGDVVSETASRATDAVRYWRLVGLLGVAPAILGILAAWWGWRTINK